MTANLMPRARYLAKVLLRPVLFRHPPIGLMPERLHLWTRTLIETQHVPGAVVEIGCAAGGTAAWCDRLLRNLGVEKEYVCVDTFEGFSGDQFAVDVASGTPRGDRYLFSANSPRLVQRIVAGLGAPDIRIVRGDICTLPGELLPERVAACLIDVDLSQPVHAALSKVYPRLSPGGVILVDDCPDDSSWRARMGYRRFATERGLTERYEFGMGVLANPSTWGLAAGNVRDARR